MMVDRKRSEVVLYGGVLAAVVLGLYLSSLYSYFLFIAMVFLTRSVTLPLARLTAAARATSRGESAPVKITPGDEIGVPAGAFDTMTGKLAAADAELAATNELPDKISSTTHVLLVYMDKDYNFTDWWRMEEQLHLIQSSVNNIKNCVFRVDEQDRRNFTLSMIPPAGPFRPAQEEKWP